MEPQILAQTELGRLLFSWDEVCGSLDGNNDRQVQDFFYLLASQIYKIVSRNAEDDQDVTAELLCNIMNNSLKGPEIDRLAALMKLYLRAKKTGCIFELYESMVNKTKETSLTSLFKEGRKNWYRICTENPYFFGSNDRKMPFFSKFSLSFILERCADIFGSKFNVNFITAGINATNEKFGYRTIDAELTNVLFVSGADDPEKSTHILHDINTDVKAIVIAGESHCTDMYPTTINDSKDLIKARSSIVHEIGNWINS